MAESRMTNGTPAWVGRFLTPSLVGALIIGSIMNSYTTSTSVAVAEARIEAIRVESALTAEALQRQAASTERAMQAIVDNVVPRAEYSATVERFSRDIADIKRQMEQIGIEVRRIGASQGPQDQ